MLSKFEQLLKEYNGALNGPGSVDTSQYSPTKFAASNEPTTAPSPVRTPSKPTTSPKPNHPLSPSKPGIQPRPKAETNVQNAETTNTDKLAEIRTINNDVNLFFKNRDS